MNKHEQSQDSLPRRDFLRRSATLVGAAGAGLVVASAQAAGDVPEVAAAKPAANTGYQESEHVRRYYRMADF